MKHTVSEMRSLLWKDMRTVKPLVIAACAGVVILNLVAFIGQLIYGAEGDAEGYAVIWVMLPNLVALGAPAMLVGGEEDSGTLSWLRTLPVRWQKIVQSKFLVGAGATFLTWFCASVFMLLHLTHLSIPARTGIWEMFVATATFAHFTCLLLLVSFVCAYFFRSAIVGLLVLIPVMLAVYVTTAIVASSLLRDSMVRAVFGVADARGTNAWMMGGVVVLLAVLQLVAFWFLQRWLGRRRLTKPMNSRRSIADVVADQVQHPYRPPLLESRRRPSPLRALFWQQYQQIAWPLMTLIVIGLISASLSGHFWETRLTGFQEFFVRVFGPIAFFVSTIGLGAMVFYGDNVNDRRMFFSDRGISPNRVWWTRILLPLLGCLLITAVAFAVLPDGDAGPAFALSVPLLFVFGQMVSMWMSRPLLSLFTGPVYAAGFGMLFGIFYQHYYGYGWTAILVVPVLLIATWWMCRQWMTGKADHVFHGKMIGFTLAAALLPAVCVLGYRWATTPPVNQAWRAKAIAASQPKRDNKGMPAWTDPSHHGTYPLYGKPIYGAAGGNYNVGVFNASRKFKSVSELEKALVSDLDSLESGEYVISNDDTWMFINQQVYGLSLTPDEVLRVQDLAMQLALKRIEFTRRAAANGEINFWHLQDLYKAAEIPEARLVGVLSDPRQFGDHEAVAKLVAMIPSADLRKQSRRRVLLDDWRGYQERPPWVPGDAFYTPTFAGISLAQPGGFGIEKERSARFLDELVRLTWDQLENGLPASGSVGLAQRNDLANNTVGPSKRFAFPQEVFVLWVKDYDDRIEDLRRQYPVKPASE